MAQGLITGLFDYKGPQAARFVLAMVLVAAVIAVVIIGMFQKVTPADVAQYLAPLSGLAGTAVGYWFGKSGETPPAAAPPPTEAG